MPGIQEPDREDGAGAMAGGGGSGGEGVPGGRGLTTGGGGGGDEPAPAVAPAIRTAGAAPGTGGNGGGGAPGAGGTAAGAEPTRMAGSGGSGGGAAAVTGATGAGGAGGAEVLGRRMAWGTGIAGRGAGTPRGSATGAVWFWRMIWLACAVPSTPQTGHTTARGIWPFTGSTSNLYFAPQLQKILISMRRIDWCSQSVNPLLQAE